MVMHYGHLSGVVRNGQVYADGCGCHLGPAANPDASRRDDRKRGKGTSAKPKRGR